MEQILHTLFDFDKGSIKTHSDPMSLTFDAENDSITSIVPFLVVKQGEMVDSRRFKRAAIYSSGPFEVVVFPSENTPPISLLKGDSASMQIVDICCAALQLNGPIDAIIVLQG